MTSYQLQSRRAVNARHRETQAVKYLARWMETGSFAARAEADRNIKIAARLQGKEARHVQAVIWQRAKRLNERASV